MKRTDEMTLAASNTFNDANRKRANEAVMAPLPARPAVGKTCSWSVANTDMMRFPEARWNGSGIVYRCDPHDGLVFLNRADDWRENGYSRQQLEREKWTRLPDAAPAEHTRPVVGVPVLHFPGCTSADVGKVVIPGRDVRDAVYRLRDVRLDGIGIGYAEARKPEGYADAEVAWHAGPERLPDAPASAPTPFAAPAAESAAGTTSPSAAGTATTGAGERTERVAYDRGAALRAALPGWSTLHLVDSWSPDQIALVVEAIVDAKLAARAGGGE